MKALVVDDCLTRINIFRENLERVRPGIAVTSASKVHESVALIQRRSYDVIFLDYNLSEVGEVLTGGHIIYALRNCKRCIEGPYWVVHTLDENAGKSMVKALERFGGKAEAVPSAWDNLGLLERVCNVIPS